MKGIENQIALLPNHMWSYFSIYFCRFQDNWVIAMYPWHTLLNNSCSSLYLLMYLSLKCYWILIIYLLKLRLNQYLILHVPPWLNALKAVDMILRFDSKCASFLFSYGQYKDLLGLSDSIHEIMLSLQILHCEIIVKIRISGICSSWLFI